ncbi:DUF1345 domain-containing protein [Gordonia sp. SID5947]|uniref:DUF1345 domain-containing protein n=1 Tax=Gordonia sp. SID5947 TaxID=2690315 RepID=UPI00136D4461|nr:DUF1345 domain-containing protein [Gordonia sp. SID5947]MYR07930.1 DUF1345 domain-containing protein [Gordonia sp. SID5947]
MTEPRNTVAGYVSTIIEFLVVVLAVWSIIAGDIWSLIAWEATAVVYLAGGALVYRRMSVMDLTDSRSGLLDTLSWIFPLVASLAGANAAVFSLIGLSGDAASSVSAGVAAGLGVLGIVVAWALLHLGFSNLYGTLFDRSADVGPALSFPGKSVPGFAEFLYLALTVGTSFATSDVEIRSTSMRILVVTHSVISFFYNALVVAAAFQLLQRLAVG